MKKTGYLQIKTPENGADHASFHVYLPANDTDDALYTQYRFVYEENPIDESLSFDGAPNNPANRRFYRIREAYVVKKTGEQSFEPLFRALQKGEVGLALREEGAGDFVGGFHGDERMTEVSLKADGVEISLSKPYFGAFETLSFYERSQIYRCNTPSERIILHTQSYTLSGDRVSLAQRIEWIADGRRIQRAFTPMLTAQRIDPDDLARILTDTVELYADDGTLLAQFDTTPYGVDGNGRFSESFCKGTRASRARVYGKSSGFSAEAGYTVIGDSIPSEQCDSFLCVRYGKGTLDNKIYFDIGGGTMPKKGTVWQSDVFYRITYTPTETEGEI